MTPKEYWKLSSAEETTYKTDPNYMMSQDQINFINDTIFKFSKLYTKRYDQHPRERFNGARRIGTSIKLREDFFATTWVYQFDISYLLNYKDREMIRKYRIDDEDADAEPWYKRLFG